MRFTHSKYQQEFDEEASVSIKQQDKKPDGSPKVDRSDMYQSNNKGYKSMMQAMDCMLFTDQEWVIKWD